MIKRCYIVARTVVTVYMITYRSKVISTPEKFEFKKCNHSGLFIFLVKSDGRQTQVSFELGFSLLFVQWVYQPMCGVQE